MCLRLSEENHEETYSRLPKFNRDADGELPLNMCLVVLGYQDNTPDKAQSSCEAKGVVWHKEAAVISLKINKYGPIDETNKKE
jgi:hypothetical protein